MIKIIAPKSGRKNFIEVVNQNNSLIFIIICYIIGILAGVLFFKYNNESGVYYYKEFNEIYSEFKSGFGSNFISSFFRQLPYAAAVFLAGSSMIGAVISPAIIALRGATYGIIMSYTCCNFGLMGIVFNLLILIPPAVISAIAIILSARESFGFSLSRARLALPNCTAPKVSEDFKLFCLRQLFVFLFFLVSALLEGFMATSFIGFFNL